jgi:ribonuclease T
MNRLILDTETTGLSPRFNKTLTVGLLLIDVEKNHLNILDQDHIFIKHKNYNSSKEALKVNKIDLEQHTLKAVHPPKACNQINSFLKNNHATQTPIVGHNIHFDKGFLNALFRQGDSAYPFSEESIDTMRIWRQLQKQDLIPRHLRSTLGHLATHFDIDYTKAHDALADCHITAQVYHEMLKLK